jgi:SAM-dependent methyltransferase
MSEPDGYWNAQAASFDDSPDHGLRDPSVRSAWRSLLLGVLPAAPARIADIGCGTGSLAILLGEAGYRVSGIDVAERMVELARAKAETAGVATDFKVADATRPPWPPATFDVILVRHLLWALPDPAVALQRWVELLAPEGRLVLIEGRWCTGAGLTAEETMSLVRGLGRDTTITELAEPIYWGGPIKDERYLVISQALAPPALDSLPLEESRAEVPASVRRAGERRNRARGRGRR